MKDRPKVLCTEISKVIDYCPTDKIFLRNAFYEGYMIGKYGPPCGKTECPFYRIDNGDAIPESKRKGI